ncbi:MAG: Tol-Pal system subunit TolQ [SAR324 cluster bacterium]|uniref:Tol-Pal system subunit TolQ n=1 Tax=SAR324 cluster bacterium TaxID=2024889 RepID=A0A7X9FTR5_9DELT|nr:Tol-Pal system subunit TolQ [SAR324 cluster bacterium]
MLTTSEPVVKSVLIILIILSILSWAITIAKILQFKKAKAESEEFHSIFLETRNFARIDDSTRRLTGSPLCRVFVAGYRELMRLLQPVEGVGLEKGKAQSNLESVEMALRRAELSEAKKLESGVTFLATVASAAPFIGLFGTVVGIMTAFHGLSYAKSSTIQAVAPGISEALFATAVGLAAAIPAAVAYNFFSVIIKRLKQSMSAFSEEFLSVARRSLSR